MSNKLEAALGGATSFTDEDGDTFSAIRAISVEKSDRDIIDLTLTFPGGSEPEAIISFFAKDATKIIALIRQAAK